MQAVDSDHRDNYPAGDSMKIAKPVGGTYAGGELGFKPTGICFYFLFFSLC